MQEADIVAAYHVFGFRPGGAGVKRLNKRHGDVTHAEFAQNDRVFKLACDLAGIPATKRQASKWRNKRGLAYQHRAAAKQQLND